MNGAATCNALTDRERCKRYSIALPHKSHEPGFTTTLDVGHPLQDLLWRAPVLAAQRRGERAAMKGCSVPLLMPLNSLTVSEIPQLC